MPNDIRYVADRLVHFVGWSERDDDVRVNTLRQILREKCLRRPPYNCDAAPAMVPDEYALSRASMAGTSVTVEQMNSLYRYNNSVCFADIPEDHLAIHTNKYGDVGIAFSKAFLVGLGARPVMYVPVAARISLGNQPAASTGNWTTADHKFREMAQRLNAIPQLISRDASVITDLEARLKFARSDTVATIAQLLHSLGTEVFGFLKFFDHTKADDDPHNYYMEREWRVIGAVKFSHVDVMTLYMPKRYIAEFENEFPMYAGKVRLLSPK